MSSSDLKMYIAVNSTLTLPQAAVQACHALGEYLLEAGMTEVAQEWLNNHKTIVILSATLQEMMEIMCEGSIRYSYFCEPDLNYEYTALCFEPTNNPHKLIRRLPLLT